MNNYKNNECRWTNYTERKIDIERRKGSKYSNRSRIYRKRDDGRKSSNFNSEYSSQKFGIEVNKVNV